MAKLIWSARMHYHSNKDEAAFFDWLQSIPGVIGVREEGHALVIELRSKRLSQHTLRELLALYTRYDGRLDKLAQFVNDSNRKWFQNSEAYWYASVFENAGRAAATDKLTT